MDEKAFDTINVIPFVDIMLVLLTIVLTTSSFIASGRIPVNLPTASKNVEETQQSKMIELNPAGEIYFDGKPVTVDGLKAALKPMAKNTPFLIRADKDVSLQHFIDVVDALKQLSFDKVAVQTKTH
jgi:biopolymer transport protein ExbD